MAGNGRGFDTNGVAGATSGLECGAVTIDEVIAALYASCSFAAGERPDWNKQREILAPNARMVRVNDNGVFEFTPRTFRENLEQMIDSGSLPSFCEHELRHETQEFGDIAHVLSVYETRMTAESDVIDHGVKSIQLFLKDGRWWISAMIWRRGFSGGDS